MLLQLLLALTFATFLAEASGGKVLVFPVDGSHWVNMKVIVEELHSRGHSVTVVRASDSWYIKEESPYYTSITVEVGSFSDDNVEEFTSSLLTLRLAKSSLLNNINMASDVTAKVSEMHRQVCETVETMFENKTLMQSLKNAGYDLVLTDPAFAGGVFLSHYLGLPLVLNVRWTVYGEAHFDLAPSPLSYVPLPGAQLTDRMTFSQRLTNIVIYTVNRFLLSRAADAHYTRLFRRLFGPEVDYFSLILNADIWLMRNDFTFEFPRPTMPNVVYMGGFQCKPAKPLPTDLEEFVKNSGEHGVIVMSLGTVFSKLPIDISEEIAAAFAQLPHKVIWRHTGAKPSTLGNNTLLVDWLPQNDLLGHPKTRLFVAHGGTNGVQEAIYHGVPILGLPLVFDQPDNISRMVARGTAKMVDIGTLDRAVFLEALREMLYEPSYRDKMQELSRLHHDQPMKPLDSAIFWIEYVMRNGGAPHLRTQSFRMSWIAYHSIDVMLTLLIALVGTLLTLIVVMKKCFAVIFIKKKKCD